MPDSKIDCRTILLAIGKRTSEAPVQSLMARLHAGANDFVRDDNALFLSRHDLGIELMFDEEGVLSAVFLFGAGEDDAVEFAGELPEGLAFDLGREQVRSRLGAPTRCSEGGKALQVHISPWDLFERQSISLHVRYSDSLDGIRRVTISRTAPTVERP